MITLPRPAIITRRTLVTGAAALAMAPRDLRAANAANWSTTDKNAAITVTSDAGYLGANSRATNTATTGRRGLRSSYTLGSGKYIIQGYFYALMTGNTFTGIGVGNGSASLGGNPGSDANAYGVVDYATIFNGATPYSDSTHGAPDYSGLMQWLAIDCSSSPKRLWWRNICFRDPSTLNTDTGWRNIAGTAGDPTTPSSGTDISALGTPLYIQGAAEFAASSSTVLLNSGGWPPLTEFVAIPSGYTMPDANYPYTVPSGSFTLTGNGGTVVISQNNMRASIVGDGVGTNTGGYSSAFPASSKTVNAIFWDQAWGRNQVVGHPIWPTALNPTNAIIWHSSGATRNAGGVTWGTYATGQTTYMLVDMVNSRAWGTLDFSTYYGNGGASPNPATNTNGLDISGITGGLSGARPGVYLNSDRYGAGTWNAGRIADSSTLPSGFTWLDVAATGNRKGRVWQ